MFDQPNILNIKYKIYDSRRSSTSLHLSVTVDHVVSFGFINGILDDKEQALTRVPNYCD